MHPELFHAICDRASAAARRLIVELGLQGLVRFRNVHYPDAEAALRAHGGLHTPALWDGEGLVEGEVAVLEALRRLGGRR